MKISNKLDEILNQAVRVKILRFLFKEKDEHTGRGIAKAIGMSASATYNSLQAMKQAGLVTVRKKGNAVLYKLNEDNYFVKGLLTPLFKKEKSVYADIISIIKKRLLARKRDIISIAIFGSVAKSQETPKSDIDLLVIADNTGAKTRVDKLFDSLSITLAQRFNIAISPYLLTKQEARIKHHKKEAIITSILSNNKLIYGEPIERILA